MIHRFADPPALAVGMADLVEDLLRTALATRGEASLAVAGGTTPQAFHRELAKRSLDWPHVHIWFGDERCVPPDDPASNYRMARETLTVDAVWHRIEGERGAGEAARRYAVALPLDVIVLGMGDDGHTASIFPGTPPLDGLVAATSSPVPPHDRVTLTLMAIRACRNVILQVQGAGKAARLAEVFAQMSSGSPTLPAAQLEPVTWMIDEAAGQLLPWSDA